MATIIYTAKLPFGSFRFAADLTNASTPIYNVDDETGDLSQTQYQTADARHRVKDALKLALESCGTEFYGDPGSDLDYDEQLDTLVENARIRETHTV